MNHYAFSGGGEVIIQIASRRTIRHQVREPRRRSQQDAVKGAGSPFSPARNRLIHIISERVGPSEPLATAASSPGT